MRTVESDKKGVQEHTQEALTSGGLRTHLRVYLDNVVSTVFLSPRYEERSESGIHAVIHNRVDFPSSARWRDIPGIGSSLLKNREIVHVFDASGHVIFYGRAENLPQATSPANRS